MTPLDFMGREIKVGDVVLKVSVSSNTPHFQKKTVSRIEGLAVYLNDWHSPVSYNDRLVVVG